jgi:FADH2 O2-dependent halogenase
MARENVEIAVVGAGFAGSLMALVVQRLGRQVILLERSRHPRFAIGESSTPFANLLLDDLAQRFDLPRLVPLAKYGRWKRAYPNLTCGRKRGFSFFQHHGGQRFEPTPDHATELLVTASPHDELADTHWFREEFDAFLVKEVQAANIPYYDHATLAVVQREPHWILRGEREGAAFEVACTFLIDATGPGTFLAKALDIDTEPAAMRTNSWSVFSHFENVGLWQDVLDDRGGDRIDYPFACDHAALHHILDDGWMYVLRFENGVTSAGFLIDGARRASDQTLSPEQEWHRLIQEDPSIAVQFAEARAVQPWFRTGRLQRCSATMAGPDWAMLPHAVYALDALFSLGNAHTLLGIERLARILGEHWSKSSLADQLVQYEAMLRREVQFADALVATCYGSFGRFDLFAPLTMFYFAGVHAAEMARRERSSNPLEEFVSSHQQQLRQSVFQAVKQMDCDGDAFARWVRERIQPLNRAGFCDPAKRNMYPFV